MNEDYSLWIAGSRSFEIWRGDHIFDRFVREAVDVLGWPDEVITGACPDGIDSLASEWARDWSCTVTEYPAQWEQHRGHKAAYVRNQLCAEKADKGLFIWDGESRGTRMSIDLALDKGMPMILYTLPQWREITG